MSGRVGTAIIGLDGATLDLIEPWVREGLLPTLGSLMKDGSYGVLQSTIPDTTPVAWPSIYTGTNPGMHGMYGFRARIPGTYDWRYATSERMARSPFWEWLAEQGIEAAVLFAPFTWPVRRQRSWVVAGRGAPRRRFGPEMSSPPELAEAIAARFGASELFGADIPPGTSVRGIAERLIVSARCVGEAATWVARQKTWDLMFVVWDQLDTAAHMMWHHSDPRPDTQSLIFRVYEAVDRAIGAFLDACGGAPTTLVCSDHGAQPTRMKVHFPLWLRREGFLSVRGGASTAAMRRGMDIWRALPDKLSVPLRRVVLSTVISRRVQGAVQPSAPETRFEWGNTSVYPDPVVGSVAFINRADREPGGIVDPSEVGSLIDDVTERLLRLEAPDGQPLVESVLRGVDVYSGPLADQAPDLAVQMREGVELAAVFTGSSVLATPKRPSWDGVPTGTGHHHPHGMAVVSGPGAKRGERLERSVLDIAPTVMRVMGAEMPPDLDGSGIEEAFFDLPPARTGSVEAEAGSAGMGPLTSEQEADLADHLRELGYIE